MVHERGIFVCDSSRNNASIADNAQAPSYANDEYSTRNAFRYAVGKFCGQYARVKSIGPLVDTRI